MINSQKHKIICIGDSLTEGDYGVYQKRGIANVHEKNYPYFLRILTGADVVNCGKCGIRASGYLKYYKDGNVDVHGADCVIIMLGTNGGLDDAADTDDNRDYDSLVRLIQSDEPNAKIVLCAPPHATSDKTKSNCGHAAQVAAAVRFTKKYASENSLECIELDTCPLFTDENEEIMQPNDGLHFSETGYAVMAIYIRDALRKKLGIF